MTFAKGASLDDPSGFFNSSLDGNTRRAIDFHEGERIDRGGVESAHSRGGGAQGRPQARRVMPMSGDLLAQEGPEALLGERPRDKLRTLREC